MNKYIEIYRNQVQRILWPEELAFNQTHKLQAFRKEANLTRSPWMWRAWQSPRAASMGVRRGLHGGMAEVLDERDWVDVDQAPTDGRVGLLPLRVRRKWRSGYLVHSEGKSNSLKHQLLFVRANLYGGNCLLHNYMFYVILTYKFFCIIELRSNNYLHPSSTYNLQPPQITDHILHITFFFL